MKTLSILILPITLLACSQTQQTKKHIPDPKAKQLNDSAIIIAMKRGNTEEIIALLDQATKIDSNYYMAFSNKFSFQLSVNHYNDALISARNLLRIRSKSPHSHVITGITYWKKGDTISSKTHFENAARLFDKILDTMSTSNEMYEHTLMNKGVNLILLGDQEKGNRILKQLYEKQKHEARKGIFGLFLNKSRQEILDNYLWQIPVSVWNPTVEE